MEKTTDELLSPQVKAFLDERRNLSVIRSSYEDMLKSPSLFPMLVILAHDNLLLLSYLLKVNPTSSYDPELLGYLLFMGNLTAVKAFENRVPLAKATLGWLTLDYLRAIGRLEEDRVDTVMDIAIMSDDTNVLDYVASKISIDTCGFIRAAEYGKINIMKKLYSSEIKETKVEEALEISLSNSWEDGVNFLIEKVTEVTLPTLVEAACYGDEKVFSEILKKGKKSDLPDLLIQIYRLDRLTETKALIGVMGLTKDDVSKLEVTEREKELLSLMCGE